MKCKWWYYFQKVIWTVGASFFIKNLFWKRQTPENVPKYWWWHGWNLIASEPYYHPTLRTVMSKYQEIVSNKYLNIFWCQKDDQKISEYIWMSRSWSNNDSKYFDAQDLTKHLSEYMQTEEKPQLLIYIL